MYYQHTISYQKLVINNPHCAAAPSAHKHSQFYCVKQSQLCCVKLSRATPKGRELVCEYQTPGLPVGALS